MEPHKTLSGIDNPPDLFLGPESYFQAALKFVQKYYPEQLKACSSVRFDDVDDDFFFREYVFVVHATGFSAKAVGKFMPNLLSAYGWWDALAHKEFDDIMQRVALVCNNPQKAKAVHAMSKIMWKGINSSGGVGWNKWKKDNLSTPDLLAKLPYVGKVTCFHLARNVGMLEFVKPDLHLVRMAKHWGFKDCVSMCKSLQKHHVDNGGEELPLGIIDLVLWYSASTHKTISIRQDGDR
jgi:endonuclease III